MSKPDYYEVTVPYALEGHVIAIVDDADTVDEAVRKATAAILRGDYDEDIGINMGGSKPVIDEGEITVDAIEY